MSRPIRPRFTDGDPVVLVYRGAVSRPDYEPPVRATVYEQDNGGIVLARWLEDAGAGATERIIVVHEDSLEDLAALLSRVVAERARKRRGDEGAARLMAVIRSLGEDTEAATA